MKIRSGFVSNSSSSSFIISIKRGSEVEKESALLFEFFLDNIKSNKAYNAIDNFKGRVKDYITNLEYEREEIIRDLYWADKKRIDLDKLAENTDAIEIFKHWKKNYGGNNIIRNSRYADKYEKEGYCI